MLTFLIRSHTLEVIKRVCLCASLQPKYLSPVSQDNCFIDALSCTCLLHPAVICGYPTPLHNAHSFLLIFLAIRVRSVGTASAQLSGWHLFPGVYLAYLSGNLLYLHSFASQASNQPIDRCFSNRKFEQGYVQKKGQVNSAYQRRCAE